MTDGFSARMSNGKAPLGCLLIHGFTSHRSSLEAVIPELDKRHIPWHYPILAGHGTSPADLQNVTWQDWVNDVTQGLRYLQGDVEKVVVVALSMGSMLGLELAATFPADIVGLVLLSPTLHFRLKLAKLTPLLSKVISRFPNPSPAKFSSLKLAKQDKGYQWFPTKTFKQYWERTQDFDPVIQRVHQSTRIIHAKRDMVGHPSGAQHIFDLLPAKQKELIWLERSGHEILLDAEVPTVLGHIFSFPPLQAAHTALDGIR